MSAPAAEPRKECPQQVLLRHFLALAEDEPQRPTAQQRLEQMVGPELAERLLASLTGGR